MIVVIFEVWPAAGREGRYLELAGELRSELEQIEGFVSVERFSSLAEPGKLLSLSIWRDEQAVGAWRANADHRIAQREGRERIFGNYRLRIATIIRDYGMNERAQAPADSQR